MKISRDEAEKLLTSKKVLSTKTEQQGGRISVSFSLADKSICTVKYDRKKQLKSYFLFPKK
jgi:hypothetical protein